MANELRKVMAQDEKNRDTIEGRLAYGVSRGSVVMGWAWCAHKCSQTCPRMHSQIDKR